MNNRNDHAVLKLVHKYVTRVISFSFQLTQELKSKATIVEYGKVDE